MEWRIPERIKRIRIVALRNQIGASVGIPVFGREVQLVGFKPVLDERELLL
jgi:hypothetical protein